MLDWMILLITCTAWFVILPFTFDVAKNNNRYRCNSLIGFRSTKAVSSWKKWQVAQRSAKKFCFLAGAMHILIIVPSITIGRIDEDIVLWINAALLFVLLIAQYLYVQSKLRNLNP
ncbi:hypothetical protein NRIC_38190 [Enterococcus florum]|uniref:SdpI family protein n=1 Tax=Enterococcus florum TaxID=2480627 RepID=A0A4P5PHX6_9ENTE|nr:SdpI family protein [Enterococcus florum]GCF95928.1 hypothetical protein NRIC_38190 [Enterococcus florum]